MMEKMMEMKMLEMLEMEMEMLEMLKMEMMNQMKMKVKVKVVVKVKVKKQTKPAPTNPRQPNQPASQPTMKGDFSDKIQIFQISEKI